MAENFKTLDDARSAWREWRITKEELEAEYVRLHVRPRIAEDTSGTSFRKPSR